MKIISLDTETTGLEEKKKSIVELGLITAEFDGDTIGLIDGCLLFGSELKIIQERFKPREPISFAAMGVHHITEKDVADCDDISKRADVFAEYLNSADYVLGHNLPFDMEVIEREIICGRYDEEKKIDTLRLAKHAWNLPGYKLASLRYRFDLSVLSGGDQHSAAFDAYLALQLAVEAALEMDIEGWKELYEKSISPLTIKIMYFGKHRGKEIKDMMVNEKGYIQWILKQPWLPVEHPDLLNTIKKLR